MVREKGIVLEAHKRQCVVLTRQGEFRTVRRAAVAVGQEIEFVRPAAPWRPLLAAACLLVFLAAGGLFTSIYPAAGYVSVDINPSVELGLNAWGRVVRTAGLDADGRNLLKSLPLYGRPLGRALSDIVQTADRLHYLAADSPDNLVVVTYAPGRLALVHPENREVVYQALSAQLKTMHVPARVLFAQVTRKERLQARRLGLSAGKYMVRKRLQSRGITVPAGQMAQMSIGRLLKAQKVRVDAISGPHVNYWKFGTVPPAKTVRPGTPSGQSGTAVVRPVQPEKQSPEGKTPAGGSRLSGRAPAAGSATPGRKTGVSGSPKPQVIGRQDERRLYRKPAGIKMAPPGYKMPPPGDDRRGTRSGRGTAEGNRVGSQGTGGQPQYQSSPVRKGW